MAYRPRRATRTRSGSSYSPRSRGRVARRAPARGRSRSNGNRRASPEVIKIVLQTTGTQPIAGAPQTAVREQRAKF